MKLELSPFHPADVPEDLLNALVPGAAAHFVVRELRPKELFEFCWRHEVHLEWIYQRDDKGTFYTVLFTRSAGAFTNEQASS